jgi:hypothetical protein
MDDQGTVDCFQAGVRDLSLLRRVHAGLGTHSTPYSMGDEGSFTKIKWLERQADRSPSHRDEVKNKIAILFFSIYSYLHVIKLSL